MNETVKSGYKTCKKCGLNHSTLVRHKCAKPKGQDEKPKFDPPKDEEGDGKGKGGGHSDHDPQGGDGDAQQGRGQQGEGQGQQGDGEAEQGQGDGQGEGEQQQGEGEGEGQAEAEQQAPQPKPPEPDAPVVVVVCTVLKFAALTAQCAKNGVIEITLSEDGLVVYGHNGDLVAVETIGWKDFEDRSTLDGEFFVKEVIDRVDDQLIEAEAEVLEVKPVEARAEESEMTRKIREAIEKHKAEKAEEPKAEVIEKPKRKAKPKLTLPVFVGQRVMCRDGKVRTVKRVDDSSPAVAYLDNGFCFWAGHYKCDGKDLLGQCSRSEDPNDVLHDADEEAEDKPKLTLPLTVGQKVRNKNGEAGTVRCSEGRVERSGKAVEMVTVDLDNGEDWSHWADTGHWCGQESDPDYPRHIDCDA